MLRPSLEKRHLRIPGKHGVAGGAAQPGIHGCGCAAVRRRSHTACRRPNRAGGSRRATSATTVLVRHAVREAARARRARRFRRPTAWRRAGGRAAGSSICALIDDPDEGDRGRPAERSGSAPGRAPACRSRSAAATVGSDMRRYRRRHRRSKRRSPEPAARAPPTSQDRGDGEEREATAAADGRERRRRRRAGSPPGSRAGRRGPPRSRRPRPRTRRAAAVRALGRSSDGPLGVGRIDRVVQPLQCVVEARLDGPAAGCRVAARSRRRSGRGSSAARRRPGDRARAPRWRRR